MRRVLLCLAILATASVVVECATAPAEDRRRPKTWNPLCGRSPVAKALRKQKCADVNAHAHCTALMQVCNTTWSNMTTSSSALETKVNMMGDIITSMGDIITSMILLLEGMYNQQMQLNLTLEQLTTAAAQTSTQVNPPPFTPVGGSPPSSGACTSWNITEAHHAVVFFTVKNFGAPSTPCSNATAEAFKDQLVADYKDKVEECNDAASTLKIGLKLSGSPTLGKDYGCVASPSATSPSSSALYFAVITPSSHFPCAG